jgi:hypothetical protein
MPAPAIMFIMPPIIGPPMPPFIEPLPIIPPGAVGAGEAFWAVPAPGPGAGLGRQAAGWIAQRRFRFRRVERRGWRSAVSISWQFLLFAWLTENEDTFPPFNFAATHCANETADRVGRFGWTSHFLRVDPCKA